MLDSKNATGLLWLGSIKTLNSGEPRVLRVVGKYVVLHGSLHRESTESRGIRLNRSLFVSVSGCSERCISLFNGYNNYSIYMYNGSLVFPKEPVGDIEDYQYNPKNYTGEAPTVIRGSEGLGLYRRGCG